MGSGKSAVGAEFVWYGGATICADQLGHEALRQSDIRARIVARFGDDVLQGPNTINRGKLGAKVFADPEERKALEEIVHPWIKRRMAEEIAEANANAEISFIVLDAAIMLEAGWNNLCNWLVYIDAPRPLRLERLARQRGWTEQEVTLREQAQLPLEEKAKKAEFTVDNSGTPEATAKQLRELVHKLGLTR